MKTRYVLDPNSGLLLDRDGNPLGRVVALTIDSSMGGMGGKTSLPSLTSTAEGRDVEEGGVGGGPARPTPSQLERDAVQRVWDYYLEVVPSRRRFDDKRKRIVTNALRTTKAVHQCTLEEAERLVKRAVLGLSRSPHHNGDNEQRQTYLEIRYALKGIGDESDDERIEKAITWAAIYETASNGLDPAKVERWLDDVRYHLGKRAIDPQATAGRERALEAYRKLTAAGFTMERLSKPPYARVTRGGGNAPR